MAFLSRGTETSAWVAEEIRLAIAAIALFTLKQAPDAWTHELDRRVIWSRSEI